MSPEAQRIAIAESLGWFEIHRFPHGDPVLKGVPPTWPKEHQWDAKSLRRLPDFPNDLNACHEFEKALTPQDHWRYIKELSCITRPEWTESYEDIFVVAHATAAQRCEAYLKTLGKWRDE